MRHAALGVDAVAVEPVRRGGRRVGRSGGGEGYETEAAGLAGQAVAHDCLSGCRWKGRGGVGVGSGRKGKTYSDRRLAAADKQEKKKKRIRHCDACSRR